MKESKKQSNKSQKKNSKETIKNLETKTDSFSPDEFGAKFSYKPGTLTSLKAKEEFTEEIIRKVFIKNAHHKDGGALGILLPKEVKNKIGLERGNYVFIKASNEYIIIRKCVTNSA